jgi:hypothetical protein
MSSLFSWREDREEGSKTRTSKQKSIIKLERKWLHVCERFMDWIKRCELETLQMTVEDALDGFEEQMEILNCLVGGPYNHLETTN